MITSSYGWLQIIRISGGAADDTDIGVDQKRFRFEVSPLVPSL